MKSQKNVIFRQRKEVPAPQITTRDLSLLLTLGTACYLNTFHIQKLFWPKDQAHGSSLGMKHACLGRLRRLLAHGYIRRITPFFRRGETLPPYIYALDKRGAETLSVEMDIPIQAIHYQRKSAEDNPSYLKHFFSNKRCLCLFGSSLQAHRNAAIKLGE